MRNAVFFSSLFSTLPEHIRTCINLCIYEQLGQILKIDAADIPAADNPYFYLVHHNPTVLYEVRVRGNPFQCISICFMPGNPAALNGPI
ncbi:hypothetical protein D3C73_1295940 [compost metagenome]